MKCTLIFASVLVAASAAFAENPPEGSGIFGAYAASKAWTPPTDPAVLKKLQQWQDQKLGLLITWGTYSQWGIVESWSLVTTRHPWNKRPEQFAKLDDRAYMKAYENLITTFNPTNFHPAVWAAAAKDAGMRYALVMAKHHDGFCMWNTATTDYKITSKRCPFHADPRADTIKQMSAAFRKQGLSTGVYFSKADWNSPNFWTPDLPPGSGQGANYRPHERPEQWRKFKEFTWRKSCAAAIKIPLYVGWYVAAQIASQIFGTEAPQHAILITLALKEFISFVQNLKAIGIRYKVNLKPLNDLVAFLRVDRFQEQLADYQKKADAIE